MVTKRRLHELIDKLEDEPLRQRAERFLRRLLEAPASSEAQDDASWLDADLGGLDELEPFDWGPSGPPSGRPIRYSLTSGFVIE
jgi:hypothetical protein